MQSDDYGATAAAGPVFQCGLTALDAQVPYRPPRVTPKPTVQGPQTAIVVGKAGEEIWIDQYGRVKVQFHWDRYGEANETSSCWVRVSHPWAGKGWGAIAIPRIGQEVIVDFLEGDPDQPIITGRVYNGMSMPPYSLPANKTKSTMKSNSSKGGGGSNELRFEDAKGAEQVYIHAQKDQDNVVENNETTKVGANRTEMVGANEVVAVALTRTHGIGINDMLNVGVARQVTVGVSQQVRIGKTLTIDVGDEIVLTTGKARITMKKDGTIAIQGKDILIEGSGEIDIKASKNVVIKGKKILQN